jgi:hypothetical protein
LHKRQQARRRCAPHQPGPQAIEIGRAHFCQSTPRSRPTPVLRWPAAGTL